MSTVRDQGLEWSVVDGRLRIDDDTYHQELTLVSRTKDTIVVGDAPASSRSSMCGGSSRPAAA
jgi:hypothetical protein